MQLPEDLLDVNNNRIKLYNLYWSVSSIQEALKLHKHVPILWAAVTPPTKKWNLEKHIYLLVNYLKCFLSAKRCENRLNIGVQLILEIALCAGTCDNLLTESLSGCPEVLALTDRSLNG